MPHSTSEHYYYCVYLFSTGRRQVTISHCAFTWILWAVFWPSMGVRRWFTDCLPTSRSGGKKIQIELLTHVQISLTCCLTDRQRPGQRIRTGIIEAIGGMCWGLALEDCFLIAGNCASIPFKLGLFFTSGKWQVGGQVNCSLEDSGHRRARFNCTSQTNPIYEGSFGPAACQSSTIFSVQLCEIRDTDW